MGGRRLPAAARVSAWILLVLVLSTMATLLLHRARFAQGLLGVAEARLDLVAADTAARLQAGLDLGLELGTIPGLPAIVDSALLDDPGIVSAEVLGRAGTVLFRAGPATALPTEPGPVQAGEEEPDPALPGEGVGEVRRVTAGPGLIAARAGLSDLFGGNAGAVVLTYARSRVDDAVSGLTWRLAGAAALLLLAAAGLVLALTRLALGREVRPAPGGPAG